MYNAQNIATTYCSAFHCRKTSRDIYLHITLNSLKLNLCIYIKESSGNCATTPTRSTCSSPDSSEVSTVASPPDEQTSKASKVIVVVGEIKGLVAGVSAAVPVQFLPKQFTAGYERACRSRSESYSELREVLVSLTHALGWLWRK